jgi:retinol dehydrogenase-14
MESLAGRVFVVTGASAGIGRETALGRNADRLARAEDDVAAAGRGAVSSHQCDFSRLDDVRALAEKLNASCQEIHALINNAGQVLQKREETADGYEATFAVNHLAPYLLTRLLLDKLLAGTPSRVVTVSSDAYRWGLLDFDDLQTRDTSYRPMKVYGNSKLANALFSWELARRTEGSGLTSNAVHPGFVSTSLGRDNVVANLFLKLIRPFVRGPAKGAETTLHVATSAEGGERSGEFWVDNQPVNVQPKARDPEWALRLWEVSADLVGLPRDEPTPRSNPVCE